MSRGPRARSQRPRIGVTGPSAGGWAAWICTRLALIWAGARPVRITPHRPRELGDLDGLILGGGADIDPSYYGESMLATIQTEARAIHRRWGWAFVVSILMWWIRRLSSVRFTTAKQDFDRDRLELGLLAQAVAQGVPVLGICRGGQLINIYFGGSLHQDIAGFYIEHPALRTIRARKLVEIEPLSRLADLTEKRWLRVNSLHHQSVKRVGQGLRVVARELSGIVQAIEHTTLPFVIGVQWHPEFLPMHPEQRRLFSRLVREAEARRAHPQSVRSGLRTAGTRDWSPFC